MNLKVSGLGAEPKKVVALGGLFLLAVIAYFYNRTPSGSPSGSTRAPMAGPLLLKPPVRAVSRGGRGPRNSRSNFMEFHPTLRPKDAELDRSSMDPTLRLDLLEKLQKVKIEAGSRSLFEYSTGPAAQLASNIPEPKKIFPASRFVGPLPQKDPALAAKAAEPPAPPIPLKFYGFIAPVKAGVKRAFFLDGEEIIVGSEGQLIKNRYKVVRIGVNSAVVEDTQFKGHQQTLPLVEEQTG